MFAGVRRGRAAMGLAIVVLLVVAGGIAYRVLAPAETLNPAVGAYPAREVAAKPRVGILSSAPLIVDGRLRVYSEKRHVWADAPVDARRQTTPYWSLRRWPAEVVGVVTVEPYPSDAPPIVVTEWSDGAVIALDARTGRIAWRTKVDAPGGRDPGLTAAITMYEPERLRTARSGADGRPVVFASTQGRVRAYDPWTGAVRWERSRGRCIAGWTGETTYVLPAGCSGSGATEILDAATGSLLNTWKPPDAGDLTPWDCAVGNSGCRLLKTTRGGHWLLGHDGRVTPEPHAGPDTAFALEGAYVEYRADRYVTLVDRATGSERWSAPLSGYVIGADEHGVYVITRQYDLVVLDSANGRMLLRLDVRGMETRKWTAGHVYISDRHVAIERLIGTPADPNARRLYGATPVLLTAV